MKKILKTGDVIVIDGKEFTEEELKNAIMDKYRFHDLTNFIRNGGVTNEQ